MGERKGEYDGAKRGRPVYKDSDNRASEKTRFKSGVLVWPEILSRASVAGFLVKRLLSGMMQHCVRCLCVGRDVAVNSSIRRNALPVRASPLVILILPQCHLQQGRSVHS